MKEKNIMETAIIEVTAENISEHPEAICFINPKHELYHKKISWLEEQFKRGLKIKLLYLQDVKRPVGFIEYTPGKFCWRAVSAVGYMFIHCLWTSGKKHQHQGLGGQLIKEAEKDASEMLGVAVITSDSSFMADRRIFEKHGYKLIEESGHDQLLVKPFREGPRPSINNWQAELKKYHGLTILYSRQCPWVARFIEEVKPILNEEKITPELIELKTPVQAQKGPSLYSVFNLIYNGKLLADRYISTTRFKNILEKELKHS
jgi:ribosomal protein S18 acetylase RimI-like enzyme